MANKILHLGKAHPSIKLFMLTHMSTMINVTSLKELGYICKL